ncbi:MAG: hypothetical protein OXM03_01795 [Chloroflexota bacterium]|nr:hypothetical protein [Chloroflexota bacterium]MDE2839340.1 hypothetical protein [Chloroflexota bacterium]MDE2930630.1 hypothetical protein [Chloroflexota bacterium]
MLKSLFVWLEGSADEDFFRVVLEPLLSGRYSAIHKVTYAQQPGAVTDKKIREVVRSHEILDYLWLGDLDPGKFPCVTAKKEAVVRQHAHLRPDRISIVVPEIEAWYLAGLDSAACTVLGIPEHGNTDGLTKEDYRKLIPDSFRSEIVFRMEVLSNFSMEVAKRKNASFAYFCQKHL